MEPLAFARRSALRAYDHGDTTTVLGDDGALRRFSGESAELVRAILGLTASARTRPDILRRLSELAGAPVPWNGAVEETIALLEAAGALRPEAPVRTGPGQAARRRRRVVLCLTGGVAASFAPGLVQILLDRGHEVRVAATRNALRFVGAVALEALTHAPLVASTWPRDPSAPVPHLDLARWAEVMVVYPATATSIARLASGSAGTVVSAAALATRAPALIVPAMNESMWSAPAVQRNLDQLREDGFFIAHPSCGHEVADAPPDRAPMLGAAPPIGVVADLIQAVLDHHAPVAPARAAPLCWDEAYAGDPGDLPWFTEALDADLADLLDRTPRGGGQLLDLGTGPGTAAIAAADRGFFVVATDISPRALDLARRRAEARPIVFLADDVLGTRVRGAFDIVIDRGLCHVLAPSALPAYAAALATLVRPGGHLLLKVHAAAEPEDHGTRRFRREEVVALLGDAFEAIHVADSAFPGPSGRAPRALLFALRRR